MKYVSIDIETTGLNPENHQMIEFGAIIEDSNNPKSYQDSPKYRRILLSEDGNYNFSSYAAKLNAGLIALIADIENGKAPNFVPEDNLTELAFGQYQLFADFRIWLLANGFKENSKGVIEIVAAGKNFASFDKRFIEADGLFAASNLKFCYRSLDPSGAFIDWDNDTTPPSTEQCKKRANLTGGVAHNALADAWDVIQLLRTQYVISIVIGGGSLPSSYA